MRRFSPPGPGEQFRVICPQVLLSCSCLEKANYYEYLAFGTKIQGPIRLTYDDEGRHCDIKILELPVKP